MASQPDQVLELLKGPWSATLTQDQQQKEAGSVAGKKLWGEVMKRLFRRIDRVHRMGDTYDERDDRVSTSDSDHELEDDTDEDGDDDRNIRPFPFLGLPVETRLRIYKFVVANEEDVRGERERKYDLEPHVGRLVRPNPPSYHYNRPSMMAGYARQMASTYPPRQRSKSHTADQKELENERRLLIDRLSKRVLARAAQHGQLVPGAEEAFQQYKLQHEMYARRCWHEEDHEEDEDTRKSEDEHDSAEDEDNDDERTTVVPKEDPKRVVYVNARGNICDDLPMLALTCRQVFSEMWEVIYPRSKPASSFKATVRNLNLFPFFRVCQMLGRPPWVAFPVQADLVDVEFDTKFAEKDDALHANTFQHVKRLIGLHWFRGFPIWGCLTGLSSSTSRTENPFTDFMYSIRQNVALWRLDLDEWQRVSTSYLRRCERTENRRSPKNTKTYWLQRESEEIVEATIDMLTKAAEYRLGYEGSFSPIARDGSEWYEDCMTMFRYKGDHRKIAYEKEHAFVNVVRQYCEEVDVILRKRLGDQYEQWEKLPDEQKLPQDIVL